MIRDFGVSTTHLHNDSTTVTVTGNYPDADGRQRGGKPTPKITQGHNKDVRPDLKQLLFILTVSADGAVPIAYRIADGNTPDDLTHIPAWDELRALVGHAGFLHVADSKLCSQQAMRHIASHGGRFVTIVPHGRREDTWFRNWAQTHARAWTEADRRPGSRLGSRSPTASPTATDDLTHIPTWDELRALVSQKPVFTISAAIQAEKVTYDAVTDGCFPLNHQRHRDDARRSPGRLPLPTQPRTPQPPAQGATGSRARLPRDRPPHRSAAALPLPRHARRGAHRT